MSSIDKHSYNELLTEVHQQIETTRLTAALSVNKQLIILYWNIGKAILEKQKKFGWGKAVVERLSADLLDKYGSIHSYSSRNLWFMRQMYEEYANIISFIEKQNDKPILKQAVSELEKMKQLVSEIPWGQNILILQKVKDIYERMFYLKATAANGWSRNVLLNQIKANAYHHFISNPKAHNFKKALPSYIAEQADEALKSHYNLEFLGINKPVHERKLELLMVENVKKLILELGYGFCFIGNQYKLSLKEKDYYIDLLFFHRKLKCLVAIEIKTCDFKPEFAGKMNFYLNLLDDHLRMEDENPSIGIILCAQKENLEVEYSLKTINKPVGIAEYQLTKNLPKKFIGKLPTIKEINKISEFV